MGQLDRRTAASCCIWLLVVVALASGHNEQSVAGLRCRAAEGSAEAQFRLGNMYATGRGVPQNYVIVHMWTNLSGAQGLETVREWRDLGAK